MPLVGRLIPTGTGVAGELARANLRDARRRSASVAAPLIVLVGLVLGNAGAGTSFHGVGGRRVARRDTKADLVVEGTGPIGAAIAAVPGVAAASTETSIPATCHTGTARTPSRRPAGALVVDPASYVAAHPASDALAGAARPGRRRRPRRRRAVARAPSGSRLPGADLGSLPVLAVDSGRR